MISLYQKPSYTAAYFKKERKKATQDQLNRIQHSCETITAENIALKTQVSSLSTQLSKNAWDCFIKDGRQSLLIGDSLIRDVDQNKLVKTQVTSIPGAKTKDVLKTLQKHDETYASIVCCVGTNNCSTDEFDGDEVTKSFKDIVTTAKTKVIDPKHVRIVSIPPRSDSTDYQEHVDILNACLSTISRDEGVTFVNNDPTFKLSDGTPNDGYLLSDGFHLNTRGTNRLVHNMQLSVSNKVTNGNIAKPKRPQKSTNQNISSGNWQGQVNSKRNRWQQNSNKSLIDNRKSDNFSQEEYLAPQTDRRCWFCGETNHVSHNCRHGRKITCYTCQGQGHKAKDCLQ